MKNQTKKQIQKNSLSWTKLSMNYESKYKEWQFIAICFMAAFFFMVFIMVWDSTNSVKISYHLYKNECHNQTYYNYNNSSHKECYMRKGNHYCNPLVLITKENCDLVKVDEIRLNETKIINFIISQEHCGEKIKIPFEVLVNSSNIESVTIQGCHQSCYTTNTFNYIKESEINTDWLKNNARCILWEGNLMEDMSNCKYWTIGDYEVVKQ